jgi:hypothetical protein
MYLYVYVENLRGVLKSSLFEVIEDALWQDTVAAIFFAGPRGLLSR